MMRQVFSRMMRRPAAARPVAEHYVEREPLRVDPGTFEAAAALASIARRLDFGGNDAAAIRAGIVSPDLAEWVEAIDALRKPNDAQVLRALGDIHDRASRKAKRLGATSLGKRFERAAFYAANARTFWQAALMAEGSDNATSER